MRAVKEQSYGIIPLMHLNDRWHLFIILHKQGNHWGFPKGKANEGEDAKQSACRELLEETGLKVETLLQEEPFMEEYVFFRKGKKVTKRVHYFPSIVSGAFLLQPEEISEGKWLLIEEAKKQLTFQAARQMCEKVELLLRKNKS